MKNYSNIYVKTSIYIYILEALNVGFILSNEDLIFVTFFLMHVIDNFFAFLIMTNNFAYIGNITIILSKAFSCNQIHIYFKYRKPCTCA